MLFSQTGPNILHDLAKIDSRRCLEMLPVGRENYFLNRTILPNSVPAFLLVKTVVNTIHAIVNMQIRALVSCLSLYDYFMQKP